MLKTLLDTLKIKFKGKVFRYLLCGIITALFNLMLLFAIIEFLEIKTPFLRNAANLFSIEVSLIFSFFVYRYWVWPASCSTLRVVLFRQIPIYHLSVTASIIGRSLVVFPVLDWLGVNYMLNTLLGIVLGSVINYTISDKWVFKTKN